MHVHRSNRTEKLADILAEIVARPLAEPLAAEVIVVQGRGMERWVAMQLSRRLGVWANSEFPFPRHVVQRVLRATLGPEVVDPRFEPESLRWAVAAQLPPLLKLREFDSLRLYLEAEQSSYRLMQLAERVAALFDQYVVYRPDMILRWEQGGETHWQARLWRALVGERTPAHMAACARDFHAVLRARRDRPAEVPARICLFGLSTLAPLYVQIFDALSRWSEVHLFVLSPSREYWAQIRSQRETLRHQLPARPTDDLEALLREEAGNPLLASLGRLGRELQEVLESSVDYEEDDADLYVEPAPQTMLGVIQGDMLALRYRGAGPDAPRLALRDDSIAVHACHSPMREVEVLHDQLRHVFEGNPDLDPQDVIVMSPSIDEYAPLIDAVFGGIEPDRQRIPYRIADRRLQSTEEVVHAFMAVLALMGTRVTASQVIDLLELDPIRERFGVAPTQIDDLRGWVNEAGVRWGIDAAHRGRVQQPELQHNTWRFGFDRLFLGYAMPGDGRRMYGGVLPYDDIEGISAAPLGALAELCEILFRYHRDFEVARTVTRWGEDLERVLGAMVSDERTRAYQHREIRDTLSDLVQQARDSGFDGEVDLETMRECLETALDAQAPGRNFLAGGVTFCALVPMRTIPFEVVCLLGMNGDAFPRTSRPLGFDLMARSPRPGDRSARDDDRYLFLEALLSARRRLLITYVGQSIHDNADRPPSVVVSELLDTIDESFALPDVVPAKRKAKERATEKQMSLFGADGAPAALPPTPGAGVSSRMVTKHPLQPFSPRYFRASRPSQMVCYSRRSFEAASALVAERSHVASPFIPGPLPLGETAREVTIDQLTRFFEKPARAFLQSRLALTLGRDLEVIDDREPIILDALERWQVGDELLRAFLRGDDRDTAHAVAIAGGKVPPGVLGVCAIEDIDKAAATIATAVSKVREGSPLDAVEIDAQLGDTRVTGVIRDVWPAGYSQCQYSRVGNRRELSVWLRHLFLNRDPQAQTHSYLVGRGDQDEAQTIRFKPVADAEGILRSLFALFWLGQIVPLPLFEYASRAYAAKFLDPKNPTGAHGAALYEALKRYEGSRQDGVTDLDDVYVEQAFRNRHPVRDDERIDGAPEGVPACFSEIALAVYRPFLAHREEIE